MRLVRSSPARSGTAIVRSRLETATLVGFVAFGVLARLWVISRPLGQLDSDAAVTGLMARHVAQGELPAFYWGANYGGSIDAVLLGLWFLVAPSSVIVLKLFPVALHAFAAVLTWRIGRRLVSQRAARLGAILFWIGPGVFVWYSTKAVPYWAPLCLALLALLLLLRMVESDPWRTSAASAFGLIVGLAWWSNPQTMLVILPASVFHARDFWRNKRALPVMVAAALVGAAPWIAHNLRNNWVSLHPLPQPRMENSYPLRLRRFFTLALPMGLGLRASFTREWLLRPVGPVLYGLALAGLAVLAVKVRRRKMWSVRLLVVLAVAYPFLYALSPFAWYADMPRYVLFLMPTAFLLLANGLTRIRVGLIAPPLVAAATVLHLAGMARGSPSYDGAVMPKDLRPLEVMMHREGICCGWADYWLAYRLTYEAKERVIATAINDSRYKPYDDLARSQARTAFLFIEESNGQRRFAEATKRRGIPVRTLRRGGFVMVVPARKVLPEEVAEAGR